MTLLELLVQELPKRGGWTVGRLATQDGVLSADGCCVSFWDEAPEAYGDGEQSFWADPGATGANKGCGVRILGDFEVAEDFLSSVISREQYESALAASKQPEWDGEGLPPVGCECEVINPGYKNKRFDRFIGEKVTVIAHDLIGPDPVAVFRMPVNGDDYEQDYHAMIAGCFRPIRTEAERKRDDVVDSIVEHYIGYHGDPKGGEAYIDRARAIYAAIAAGKIPGIKLAD